MAVQNNIGLFNECFPPVMDGVSVCVKNYAYWLQKMAGGVSVITPKNHGVEYKEEYEVLQYASVPVPFRKPYVTGLAEIDPVFMTKLLQRNFRIVHAHSPFTSGFCARHLASHQNIPLVATFHSKYKDDFERVIPSEFAVDQIIKLVVDFYEAADEVWVPQASVKDVLYDYGYKGEIEVVDNGSDLSSDYPESYFSESKKSLGIKEGEFSLLFVGQHIWEKNTRAIIEGLELVKDIPFRMFFVGTGYAAEDMKKLVYEKGLEDKVTFEGVITDREKLKAHYAAADLFLFPSLYDNAPLVVREAAALHTASIMAKGATASTIIDDGINGFLTENNPKAFSDKLRQLYSDPDSVKKVGIMASRTLVRSWEDVCSEVLDRYNDIISRKKLIPRH